MFSDALYSDALYCDQTAAADKGNLKRERPLCETDLPLDFDRIKHARTVVKPVVKPDEHTVVKPDFGYGVAPCYRCCPMCEKVFSAAMALTQHAAECEFGVARQREDRAKDFIMHATQLFRCSD